VNIKGDTDLQSLGCKLTIFITSSQNTMAYPVDHNGLSSWWPIQLVKQPELGIQPQDVWRQILLLC